MIVTDGRVMLGSEAEEAVDLAVIPRHIRIHKETVSSDRGSMVRSMTRDAERRGGRAEVLPPERDQFLTTYLRVMQEQSHIVSVHYLQAFDGAAREARICRQLMQPSQQVEVYEAKALEAGTEWLLRTAASLASAGATTPQVIALLRYLETHMQTLLLTPGGAGHGAWVHAAPPRHFLTMVPACETLWFFDTKQRRLTVASQGIGLHKRLGAVIQTRWKALRYQPRIRYRGYSAQQIEQIVASLQAIGLQKPEVSEATVTFLPCLPRTFAEVLLIPSDDDLRRLSALVQDPTWWKGGAS